MTPQIWSVYSKGGSPFRTYRYNLYKQLMIKRYPFKNSGNNLHFWCQCFARNCQPLEMKTVKTMSRNFVHITLIRLSLQFN